MAGHSLRAARLDPAVLNDMHGPGRAVRGSVQPPEGERSRDRERATRLRTARRAMIAATDLVRTLAFAQQGGG